MKTRLDLTIDKVLLENINAYAASKHISVSELVETYFKKISRSAKKKTILHLVDQLNSPIIDQKANLKEQFYKEQYEK